MELGQVEKKLGWVEAMAENEKFNRVGDVCVKPRPALPQKLCDFEQDSPLGTHFPILK